MAGWHSDLDDIVGRENVVTDSSVLRSYLAVVNSDSIASSVQESDFVVARPRSTDEVVRIVRFAARNKVSLVARGAGTSREGAVLPVPRSVVVDFTSMSHVLSIDAENGLVVAEPGIALDILETRLNERGLSVGHGPDHASLGGSISTNSLGQGGSRFGDMRNFVADLEVVVGDGTVLHTGRSVWRNNTGYSLTQLMIGSEGTLGLITRVTLKAGPMPEATAKRMYAFQTGFESAVELAREIERAFLPDGNRADDEARNDGGVSTVRVTFKGKREVVDLQTRLCDELVTSRGGEVVPDEISKELVLRRGMKAFEIGVNPTDVRSVPEEPGLKFTDWRASLKKWKTLCAGRGIEYCGCQLNISYPGVITFYSAYPIDSPSKVQAYLRVMDEFYSFVIERGGSFSATHGVGNRMSKFMASQYPEEYLRAAREIKRLFDPLNIFNPEKMF